MQVNFSNKALTKSMHMIPQKKAFIMGAGIGTRLYPLTQDICKPMVPIANRPLIENIIRFNLVPNAFTDITVSVHHFADSIRDHLDELSWGANISYYPENTLLGTAGGVYQLGKVNPVRSYDFLVMGADPVLNLNFHQIVAVHRGTSFQCHWFRGKFPRGVCRRCCPESFLFLQSQNLDIDLQKERGSRRGD